MISSLRRPSRFIPLAVLLVLAGAALWFWRGAQSSTLASEDGALTDFRARAAQGSFDPRPGVPTPGVYHFRQSGSEHAGSGPLTVSRDLPAQAVYGAAPRSPSSASGRTPRPPSPRPRSTTPPR